MINFGRIFSAEATDCNQERGENRSININRNHTRNRKHEYFRWLSSLNELPRWYKGAALKGAK